MSYRTLMFVLSVGILGSTSAQSALPQDEKFEGVYKGEGVNCDGILAKVEVNSNTVLESEEGVAQAVAKAVADAITAVEGDPTVTNVVAQADAAAKTVLEVVARAVATVSAEIDSPNPGCWTIAFGRAQAVAIAQATVTAIAQAFAEAEASGQIANVEGEAQTVETDVEIAVEEIALLLADGSGAGSQSDTAKVEAVARATAVNCAFAEALAAVIEGDAQAEVLAAAGCDALLPGKTLAIEFEDMSAFDGCACLNSNSAGAPNQCGLWGDGDYICYVQDINSCFCAYPSSRYSNIGWRYCGPTLQEQQKWLSFEDVNNGIITKESDYGYCGEWNWDQDPISENPAPAPAPSPTPTPTPAPGPPTVACPLLRCLGSASTCCGQTGQTCSTRFGTYNYLGKCETGQDVYQRGSFTPCACV